MNILADVLSATILFAVPLLLVALGGMFSERSGIINLALEGIMIVGALLGCHVLRWLDPSVQSGAMHGQVAVLISLAVAGVAGILFSLLLAFSAINLKADQTIGGTALNMFAPAFSIVLTWAILGQGQTTMTLPKWTRITQETLGITPNDGFFQRFTFTSLYLTTFLAIILFAIAVILLYKTRFGLRLRACGENPQAADSLGINVYKMRYAGTTISGALAGMGGFVYALTTANCSSNGDVAGFGFLALAVMIFGNWKPLNIAGASLLFGLFKCIAAAYTSLDINGDGVYLLAQIGISAHFYQMLPYLITIIVLAFTSKSSRAPKAEGIPYDKGSR